MKTLFTAFVLMCLGLTVAAFASGRSGEQIELNGYSGTLLAIAVKNIPPTAAIGRCCSNMPDTLMDFGFPCHSDVQTFLQSDDMRMPEPQTASAAVPVVSEIVNLSWSLFRPPII